MLRWTERMRRLHLLSEHSIDALSRLGRYTCRLGLTPIKTYRPWKRWVVYPIVITFLISYAWICVSSKYPILPGYAIGGLGLVAVILSFRAASCGSAEKATWILIGTFLLVGELIIIHSDRLEHDEADRIQAVTRQQEFDATTDRLTTALNGIQKTLIAANTTLIQTQPHALFGDPRVLLLPGPFVAGQHIDYELTFTNDGNETAQRPYIYSKSYVGKPSDGTVEKQLKAKFEQDWRAAKGPAIRHTDIPSHSPHVGRYPTPTFAQSDIDNINAATDTIYIFSRVDYTDETGHWFSDGCLGIFVPLRKPPDNAGATPCFDRSTVRYHPKHN